MHFNLFLVFVSVICGANGAKESGVQNAGAVRLPGFSQLAHGVSSGTVTINNSRQMVIPNLTYDGQGPDAYFLVGKGQPNGGGRKIANETGRIGILHKYTGQTVKLQLPSDLTWNDVDYLAIYCIKYKHLFGQIRIPADLKIPKFSSVQD